ncbi:MAG: MoaD/ThiS family protein [Myxococcota bacterium]|nr:MoaD/ThiS family protein [Myxococcota bacterium]
MPKVVIPPPYRGPTAGAASLEVEGSTVGACLRAVERTHPGFLTQVCGADGEVHRFVRVFRNGEQLEGEVLEAPVSEGDEIEILAAIAGG